jgi:hypothetical protein
VFAVAVGLLACAGNGLSVKGKDAGQGGGDVATGGSLGSGGTSAGQGGLLAAGGKAGGAGGWEVATGGVTSQGGSADAAWDEGVVDAPIAGWPDTGQLWEVNAERAGLDENGAIDVGGLASPDASCDMGRLWQEISDAAGVIGYCFQTSDSGSAWGYVVLDNNGRVMDNTRLYGQQKQGWLDSLAHDRWPCLAGQTVPYACFSE